MRNITAFTVLVIIGLCSQRLPAQGKEFSQPVLDTLPQAGKKRSWGFSLSPQFGMVHGQAIECVYPGPQNHGKYLSELLWDMKPVWYYGAVLDFGRIDPRSAPGFFARASFKLGIPGESGILEDRDWQSEASDVLTDYSRHDNTTSALLILDGELGASIPAGRDFVIRLFASVSYMRFNFEGFDGYGKYNRYNHDWTVSLYTENVGFTGKIITYSQNWLVFSPGLSFEQRFSRLTFGCSLKISPLTLCADIDEHLVPPVRIFRDYPRWGLFIEPRFSLSLDIASRLAIGFDIAWRSIGGARGDVYQKTAGTGTVYTQYKNGAGAGLELLDAGLLFKVRI
jgi:outer membrane protease